MALHADEDLAPCCWMVGITVLSDFSEPSELDVLLDGLLAENWLMNRKLS